MSETVIKLGEALGWVEFERDCGGGGSRWVNALGDVFGPWRPLDRHDHAQLALDEVLRRGYVVQYADALRAATEGMPYGDIGRLLAASPKHKSEACLAALHFWENRK